MDNGGVFILGGDGEIYELEYGMSSGGNILTRLVSGGPTVQPTLHKRTGGLLFTYARGPKPLEKIAAEPDRGYLFAVAKESQAIECWDTNGGFKHLTTCHAVENALKGCGTQSGAVKIVSISPVRKEASAHVILEVLASNGKSIA